MKKIYNAFQNWLYGGKGFSIWKAMFLGLSICIPIVIIMIAPWVAWLIIPADKRYLAKYDWLQDFYVAWPISIFALGLVVVLASIIKEAIKQNKP